MTIMPFSYQDAQVRVITGDDKQPWFVATDIAVPLGLANIRSSLALLDEDERVYTLWTPLGCPADDHLLRSRSMSVAELVCMILAVL